VSRSVAWDPAPALRRHLEALVGERSPGRSGEGLRRAEGYAARVFEQAGLAVSVDPIGPSRENWSNVIGDLTAGPAVEPPGPPLFVVGGHIDAVEGSPGADDNASGAAAMLALAERFGAHARGERRLTLRFAAFNLEEWGMLGSHHHADALRAAGRSVEGMISLEMLGYADARARQRYPPGVGLGRRRAADFISVVGNGASRALTREVSSALATVEGLPVEAVTLPGPVALLIGAALSDHASFWRRGIPAVMVGDTAFYRNPHYHRPSDRIETLDLAFLAKVTRGLAIFLEQLIGPRP
jgi:Zn-dependent M28 family amino/carboxypeptidase